LDLLQPLLAKRLRFTPYLECLLLRRLEQLFRAHLSKGDFLLVDLPPRLH
jgi:hypothetical protein